MILIFASGNNNKTKEIAAMLPEGFLVKSLKDLGFSDEIPETEPTIEGNALLKARFIYEKFNENCFADDTGLEVEALNGDPGVFSARYAGPAFSAADNIQKLILNLKGEKNRRARFRTVVALILDGREMVFEGIVYGVITEQPVGENGFGYDPVFIPEGYDCTFAEMDISVKNKISHRGKAMNKMISFLSALSNEI
jgi:XTP/dITP diphosphohydrolase